MSLKGFVEFLLSENLEVLHVIEEVLWEDLVSLGFLEVLV